MGYINNNIHFAEFEYGIQNYFNQYMSPVMGQVREELNARQFQEIQSHQDSIAGILSSANPYADPMNTIQKLQLTGEWNGKTTEDYLKMCNEKMSSNPSLLNDVNVLSQQWRTLVIQEVGREKYDHVSKQLGADLAYAYVDHRIQQMMIDKLVQDKVPKSSMDYIMQKAGKSSIFGLSSELMKTPIDVEIDKSSTEEYSPTGFESVTGTVLGASADIAASGGMSSWASFAKYLGLDLAVNSFLSFQNHSGSKGDSVEKCISQGVFNSSGNVFADFRKDAYLLDTEESSFLSNLNNQLDKKIFLKQFKFGHNMFPEPEFMKSFKPKERDERYKDIPAVIMPGQEEAYLKSLGNNAQQPEVKNVQRAESEQSTPIQAKEEIPQEVVQPEQNNTNGWNGLLTSIGFDGIGDVTKNLGFVLAMLPDMLVGLFTGKSKSLLPENNLLPLASIVGGLFVKNPVLKMMMIGMGAVNMLNKSGKESIQQRNNPDGITASQQSAGRFKIYEDEVLNQRIQQPHLQGNCLIATIDKVPCSITLSDKVIDAYNQGALPLNTLANAVLARNDQMRQIAQEKFENANTETASRTRGIQ